MIRIAHISDIHFSKLSLEDFNNFLMKSLIKDLIKFNEVEKIDFLVISGDMINKGGEGFDSPYEALIKFREIFIHNICESLSLEKSYVFITAGNHEILRREEKPYSESGLEKHLSDTTKLNEFIDNAENDDLKRILSYKKFENEFYEAFNIGSKKITLFESSFFFEKKHLMIGITSFNSAWRCFSEDDKGKLLVGERQITNTRKVIENANIKIAILHHPLEWLADFDRKNITPLIYRDYDLVLYGHTHELETKKISNLQGKVLNIQAPSNWSYGIRSTDINSSNGYTIIDYILEEEKIVLHHRLYSHRNETYVPNTIFGDETGKEYFRLPTKEDLQQSMTEYRVAKMIESLRIDLLNEHLISFSTNTNAPKELNKLFVEPRLFYIEKDETGEEKEIIVSVSELIATDMNTIIFGTKESGKTILLDHLLIRYSREINEHHKIPVYFDFNEIGNKRFETIISQYLNEPILEIPNFINKNKIIFLIDNLNFNQENEINLKRLIKFIKEFNVQFIASSFQYIQGEPPIDFINYRPDTQLSILHIKSFNAHQIRTLIDLWFSNNQIFDTPEKCENILNILLALNLPRSPLTISMFLWIIEQQEGYRPQNKAIMLENFLEKLLEKASKKSIFSEKFDYTNKVHLLSEIAYLMYNSDNNNYGLNKQDLLNFIHERLVAKKFEFDSSDILNDLVNKGIFVQEQDGTKSQIRFRFSCFFEFFLMKKLDSDPTFLEAVLSNQNYLNFINEIDYLTGIKRDKKNILELIVKDMNELFEKLIEKINSSPDSFDIIFSNKKESIARHLDQTFIKEINSSKSSADDKMLDIQDQILDKIQQEKELIKKNRVISKTQKLERIWTLAARVLKNTEEIDVPGLKSDSFNSIIKCSLGFAVLYKTYLDEIVNNKTSAMNISQYEYFLSDFLPLIHQMVLNRILGTAKLNVVIRERLDTIINDDNVTDFEKYIIVFTYSDLQGKDHIQYIKKFVKSIKRSNLFDVTLFKLLTLYYFRSRNEEIDKIYENLIGDVIIAAKGWPKINKGNIIEDYRKKKKKQQEKKDDDFFIL